MNASQTEHMARDTRYERAREWLDVVCSLWDSWTLNACAQDKATRQHLDPSKVRMTTHNGKHVRLTHCAPCRASAFSPATAAKSDALCRQLQSLISPVLGVPTKIVGFDLSRHNLEGPLPEIHVQQVGGTASGQSVVVVARREGSAIRQRQIATSCNRSRSHDLPVA